MNSKRFIPMVVAIILALGIGSTHTLFAQPQACVKNNNICAISVKIFLSDGTVCAINSLNPGQTFCCPIPNNQTFVTALEIAGILVSPPPGPGACVGLSNVCPGNLCAGNARNQWSVQL